MNRQGLFLTRAEVPYEVAAKWTGPQGNPGFADPYAWHQRVWECFPNRDGAPRDFLTRVDPRENGYRLVVLSESMPQRPGWCPSDGWETKPVPPDFLGFERYRFSLLANPTKKLAAPRDADGRRRGARRISLSRPEDLLDWLERKASQHGFAIDRDAVRIAPRPRTAFRKAGKGDSPVGRGRFKPSISRASFGSPNGQHSRKPSAGESAPGRHSASGCYVSRLYSYFTIRSYSA